MNQTYFGLARIPMFRMFVLAILAISLSVAASMLHNTFSLPDKYLDYVPPYSEEIGREILIAESTTAKKNLVLFCSLMGMAVSVLLTYGSAAIIGRGKLKACLSGLIVGALFGALGGFASRILFDITKSEKMDIFITSMLGHGGIYLGLGIGLALSLKISLGKAVTGSTLMALFVSSLIAAALYPFVAAVAFPLLQSDIMPPEGIPNRTFWMALPILLFASVLVRSLSHDTEFVETRTEDSPEPSSEPVPA